MNNSEKPAFAAFSNDHKQKGLTKREYFAAMAMQGILSGSGLREQIHIQFPNTSAEEQYAIVSVASIRIADELLKTEIEAL